MRTAVYGDATELRAVTGISSDLTTSCFETVKKLKREGFSSVPYPLFINSTHCTPRLETPNTKTTKP